jgi:hypothetical protein
VDDLWGVTFLPLFEVLVGGCGPIRSDGRIAASKLR